ncbi:MAG TPA: hypothetical protein VD969_03660 [Symbiobacteriaceae bacterium]|nr:hypothetical protein [Symbiobacteriaceae bacterium]
MRYEIRVAGRLPANWADWFDGFSCTATEAGETVLTGPAPDQSALVGLLTVICHMNLILLSVRLVDRNGK